MKKVWSSPSLVQCDLMKAMLEGDGITCVIQNENSARFAGIGMPLFSGQALGFAWPEIWVPDEQFDQAQELVREVSKVHEKTLKEDPGEKSDGTPEDESSA